MTNPTRKRVVTLDDLNVLNQNAAYARQKGEEASAAAQLADTARQNLEVLGGDTQAAGEQATQAAQAATLAKNTATAAALQASQAAGDAVTAAELAEGAAGSANQAAGAATTAAQRVTDAVLDLTDIKVDIAQSEAQLLAASGRIPWAGGDHTTLPSGAGDYLITRGAEAGQVWTRATNGAKPERNDKLESLSAATYNAAQGRPITSRFFGLHEHYPYYTVVPTHTSWHWGTHRHLESAIHWRVLNPSPGVYNWAPMDARVAYIEQVSPGTEQMYCFAGPPDYATGGTQNDGGFGANYNIKAPDPAALKAFAQVMAARYAGRIQIYEAWNEVNYLTFLEPTLPKADRVAICRQIAQAVYEGVKLGSPSARVTSPNVTGDGGHDGLGFLRLMLDAGIAPYADLISVHLYNSPAAPEGKIALAGQYRALMAEYGLGSLELWDTEDNFPHYFDLDTNLISNTLLPADRSDDYLIRMFLAGLAGGVDRMFVYEPSAPLAPVKFSKALLQITNADPPTALAAVRPAGAMLTALMNEVIGARVVDYQYAENGTHTLTLQRGAERFAYVWTHEAITGRVRLDRGAGVSAQLGAVATLSDQFVQEATGRPKRVTLSNANLAPVPAATLDATRARRSLVENPYLDLPGGAANEPTAGVVTNNTQLLPYQGATPPRSGLARTLRATAQFGQLIVQLPPLESGTYEVVMTYATAAAAGQWVANLNTRNNRRLHPGLQQINLNPTTGFATITARLNLKAGLRHLRGARLVMQAQVAGIADLHIERLDIYPSAELPAMTDARVRIAGPPVSGNFQAGDVVEYTDPAVRAVRGPTSVCITAGSYRTDAGLTGSITTGTSTLTVAGGTLEVGDVIQLAGLTPRFTVMFKTETGTYWLDANAAATVAGAALTFPTPVWRDDTPPPGAAPAAPELPGTTQGAAFEPTTTNTNGPTRYLTTSANKLRNGSGELGGEAWTVVSGTFATAATGTAAWGAGRYFDLSTAFEVYQDAAVLRNTAKPLYLTAETNSIPGGLEYQIEELASNGSSVGVLQSWTAFNATTVHAIPVTPTQAGTGYLRIRLRGVGVGQRQFRGLGVWVGVPGAVLPAQAENIRWLYDALKALPAPYAPSGLIETTQAYSYSNSGTVFGAKRYVSQGTNKLRNSNGELGGEAWTVVSGTFATATTNSHLGGPGRMFDISTAFEVYQEYSTYLDTNPLHFTVDAGSANGGTLEYRVEHYDSGNALTVLKDWTGVPATTTVTAQVAAPAAGNGRIRVCLRALTAGQKQFRNVGMWHGLPGLVVGPLESIRWLYDNKVSTTQAATTATLGLVKRAAALTAAVPASTALTFSNPPTQAECQALAARVEQMRAFQADLYAKLTAAGIAT